MAFRGDLLRAWRRAEDLSQKEVASKVGITQGMWNMLEHEKTEPSIKTLIAITRLTGIPMERLLDTPTESQISRG